MRPCLAFEKQKRDAPSLGRVLEIGCGTGLLLFSLADQCSGYFGIDLTESVIRDLREVLAADTSLSHVEVHACAAHKVAEIARDQNAEPFDLILINSVAQYFPDPDYLADVLEQAILLAAPGAHIFVGDVRNARLQRAFCRGVEVEIAAPSAPLSEILERAKRRVSNEQELVIDPTFFNAFGARRNRVSGICARPKAGSSQTEMNLFRYDVTIQLDHPPQRGSSPKKLCAMFPGPSGTHLSKPQNVWRDRHHGYAGRPSFPFLSHRQPTRRPCRNGSSISGSTLAARES